MKQHHQYYLCTTAVWKSLQKKYIISISIHKNPIFEGALSRTFTIFSGLVENLLVSPQKILPPSPPPRNTKKGHVFNINVIDFPYYIFFCQTAVGTCFKHLYSYFQILYLYFHIPQLVPTVAIYAHATPPKFCTNCWKGIIYFGHAFSYLCTFVFFYLCICVSVYQHQLLQFKLTRWLGIL